DIAYCRKSEPSSHIFDGRIPRGPDDKGARHFARTFRKLDLIRNLEVLICSSREEVSLGRILSRGPADDRPVFDRPLGAGSPVREVLAVEDGLVWSLGFLGRKNKSRW